MGFSRDDRIVVCGAGGFIGGHLLAALARQGYRRLRAVDIKPLAQWYQRIPGVEDLQLDLRDSAHCPRRRPGRGRRLRLSCGHGRDGVHREQQGALHAERAHQHASADGRARGRGRALLLRLFGLRLRGRQAERPTCDGLKEADAYPAMPEDGYGWEKLFSERMCRHFREDFGLRRGSRAITTCTVPTAPTTAAARRRPRRSVERSPGQAAGRRDRDLGRRRADPQLHLHRRLHRRDPGHHGQ